MNSASALLASIRSHRRRGPASEWTHAGPVAAILFEDAVATIQRFISEDPLALGGVETQISGGNLTIVLELCTQIPKLDVAGSIPLSRS